VTTDPSSNHTDACGLHEPETGKWLLRSPDYQNWKGGSNRFLWLHGIPGAGKTVLSSHIIEDVKGHCKSSPTEQYGWTFYYCYFLREQDETTHFLRWILNQLCRQCNHIPEILLEHYNDGIQPSLKILLGALTTLVLRFSRVFVVIDALDESKNRSSILKLLTTIAEDHEFANVNLLVLSRNEIGIGKAIKSISTDISLSNSLVDEDIELYIQKELQDNAKFGRWTPALKSGVAAALTSGANDMYVISRWL
jgi:NACHT domain